MLPRGEGAEANGCASLPFGDAQAAARIMPFRGRNDLLQMVRALFCWAPAAPMRFAVGTAGAALSWRRRNGGARAGPALRAAAAYHVPCPRD